MAKRKRKNNYLQKPIDKTIERATRTPLKTRGSYAVLLADVVLQARG
jgi:Txe/YoeB family toxin of Txe-Axe toxin-antitoxin module